MANELLARMNSALESDTTNRHSLFQLKHFILGKETTVQGQMWQCLREIRVRKETLDSVQLEIDESKDKLELLFVTERQSARQIKAGIKIQIGEGHVRWDKQDLDNENADQNMILTLNHRIIGRKIKAAEAALVMLEEKKRGYEAEVAFFLDEFEKLKALNPVKALDDFDAQKEYWTAKLFQEVHIKSLLGQPLETDLVKTVLSMPDDSPVKAQMLSFLTSIRDAKVKAVAEHEQNPNLLAK